MFALFGATKAAGEDEARRSAASSFTGPAAVESEADRRRRWELRDELKMFERSYVARYNRKPGAKPSHVPEWVRAMYSEYHRLRAAYHASS